MSCAKRAGLLVVGFARVIMFVVSVIVAMCGVTLLAIYVKSRSNFVVLELGRVDFVLSSLAYFGAYLVLLGAAGMFSAFSMRFGAKMFAWMLVIHLSLGGGLIIYAACTSDTFESNLAKELLRSQTSYDWFHSGDAAEGQKLATAAWDELQTELKCCGTKTGFDWMLLRPRGHEAENILPATCCVTRPAHGDFCRWDRMQFHKDGCIGRIRGSLVGVRYAGIGLINACFLLSILAGLLLVINLRKQACSQQNVRLV